ncbi:gasdermin-C-like [Talpa occidentalis]|uniref:gasdermin-C-like n=1 Tax=Talpa occidentalis TaxID=50954 RepID=UPI0023F8C9A6|nr:gasdermin-C-like [Talpa occidentalis]
MFSEVKKFAKGHAATDRDSRSSAQNMPIFESLSKIVAKEVGGKEMRHVKCVDHASSVKLYSLLLEKKSYTKFWSQDEEPIEISLLDILEPSSSLPDTEVKGPLTFSDTVLKKLKVAVNVGAVVDTNVSVAASESKKSTLQYQIVTVPPPKFEELRKRKLLDPQPSYMKQYRRSGKNLYVVTKTVELLNSPVLSDSSSGGVSGGVSFPWNPATKAKAEGEGQTSRETALTLQKGMVMAYKKKLLVCENSGWSVIEVSDDKKKKTFEELEFRGISRGIPFASLISAEMWCGSVSPIPPIGSIEEPSGQDFKCLEKEVFMNMEKVALLSRNIRAVMFTNIQAMLGDRQALQDLMDTLDQEKPLGHLSGPGATILDELGRIPGYPHVDPVDLILYLLEAIMVLSDTQHALLAQSMEKRILPCQRELVRSILEPNFKYPWWIPFTLDSKLLTPLQGEGVAITSGLLQECGLRMEPNNPRSTWDLEAKEPLSALFASLCLLQQLTEA